ncbi:MAG: hypothetical protein K1X61_15625 [Chitinophagales bacterium]|nr:hypothetical protein [Chitinophagales bacterium]
MAALIACFEIASKITFDMKSALYRQKVFVFAGIIILVCSVAAWAQNPVLPPTTSARPHTPPVFLLNLTPLDGGKPFTVFRNTKVHATLVNGVIISGKVKAITRDSIYVNSSFYALSDITEFRFNPGTALGAAAAIGACVGIATIAITAGGGKDGERSDGEEIALWSGVGITVVSAALLIPNYFIKKRFPRTKYDFRTIQIGG